MKIRFYIYFLFIFYSCTVSPRYNSLNSDVNSTKINIPQKKTKSNFKNKYYGVSSWYGPNFHGKLTANGEVFDMYGVTAAHKDLPLNTVAKITNEDNGKNIILRITDRGPFVNDRIIDLSSRAADILDLKKKGTGLVRVTVLKEKSIMLENLAKKGSFPEISSLPKPEVPKVNVPKITAVKIEGSKKRKKIKKKINYDLQNLKKEYSIYIKLASFSSLESAKTMKEKLSYLKKVKIYKINSGNKTLFQVKAGPFLNVEKVDGIHALLLEKGMQGAKIVIE